MNDMINTVQSLKELVARFVQEREWEQFHTPKNLSMNIAIEAAELMEKFRWLDSQASHTEVLMNRQEIEDELADIFMSVMCFANATSIDLSQALKHKMASTAEKYPIEKFKGRDTKYTKL